MRNLAFFIIIITTIIACEAPKRREEAEPVIRQEADAQAGLEAGISDMDVPDMDAAPCDCADMSETPCECLDFDLAGEQAGSVEAGVEG